MPNGSGQEYDAALRRIEVLEKALGKLQQTVCDQETRIVYLEQFWPPRDPNHPFNQQMAGQIPAQFAGDPARMTVEHIANHPPFTGPMTQTQSHPPCSCTEPNG